MTSRVAVISGITGQDGSYLAELLVSKGYQKVYGLVRRSSVIKLDRLAPGLLKSPQLILKDVDLSDSFSIHNLLKEIKTSCRFDVMEIYNLGAQSHVKTSFETPEYTSNVDAFGPLRFLEAIRHNDLVDRARFYQACTSEMFGMVQEIPQKETTPFYPRSPYGVAKLYGYWITKNYRESYGIYACNGILFNHESERRGEDFVTRKVTIQLAEIHRGEREVLELGNIDAQRDWGHARDYVHGMWQMMQHPVADDFVLATGETHSVRDFIEEACKVLGTEIKWEGEGVNEIGRDTHSNKVIVRINPEYFRPAEVDLLVGDYTKAKKAFGWEPEIDFKQLVRLMVEHDLRRPK